MTLDPKLLSQLARRSGVETAYSDVTGRSHDVSIETLCAVLGAMGHRFTSDAELRDVVEDVSATADRHLVPEVIVATDGAIRVPVKGRFEWQLSLENGEQRQGEGADSLHATPLESGIHELTVSSRGAGDSSATVLAAPPRAPGCKALTGQDRIWGVSAPLYGLQSQNNLGVGTYGDLATMAKALAGMGADYIAINPVHALFPTAPEHFSPYSPSHRRFFNTAHIDLLATPEFEASPAARAWLSQHGDAIGLVRAATLVDYCAASELRDQLFELLFDSFEAALETGGLRKHVYDRWLAEQDDDLDQFAVHQALSEQFGPFWTRWPAQYQQPHSSAVQQFAAEHVRLTTFHKYLQFVAEEQVQAAQDAAVSAGMGVGVVSDLAVGVRRDGSEVWSQPDLFASGVSLGAPPDAFNADGQNWQLAPLVPDALRRDGYRAFARILNRTMRHAGAIRIDHIAGFRRSFWIPENGASGTYVSYPLDELLAVTLIEAERCNCLVIGEDLGNIPRGLRGAMRQRGIYGCRLLYFERETTGAWLAPGRYDRQTAASLGSHDLPAFAGWWRGDDIEAHRQLNLMSEAEWSAALKRRAEDRRKLMDTLGLASTGDDKADDALLIAIHRLLVTAGSELVTIQMENLFGSTEQLNLPGTIDEHPNWRHRMPPAEQLFTHQLAQRIVDVAATLRPHAASLSRTGG